MWQEGEIAYYHMTVDWVKCDCSHTNPSKVFSSLELLVKFKKKNTEKKDSIQLAI